MIEDQKEGDEANTHSSLDTVLFSFIGDFINIVGKSQGFGFCVWFLSEKDKQIVNEICLFLEKMQYPEVPSIKKAYELS